MTSEEFEDICKKSFYTHELKIRTTIGMIKAINQAQGLIEIHNDDWYRYENLELVKPDLLVEYLETVNMEDLRTNHGKKRIREIVMAEYLATHKAPELRKLIFPKGDEYREWKKRAIPLVDEELNWFVCRMNELNFKNEFVFSFPTMVEFRNHLASNNSALDTYNWFIDRIKELNS